jgi:hypothetical protein
MIAIIIVLLVATGISGYAIYCEYLEDGIAFGLLFGFMVWLVVLIVGIPLISVLSMVVPHTFTYERRSIVALQDGSQVEGTFFLGSGVVNDGAAYFYYTKDGNSYRYETADASTVRVFQGTDRPYLVQQTGCKSSVEWLVSCISDNRVTEIHVPTGTIKTNLVLDAKQ